jgi:hypothetical protein
MERFFSLNHLSTQRLHNLYREAYRKGTQIIEYDEPGVEGHTEIALSEKMILENIRRENHNYLVYQKNMADDTDCIRIAFGLTDYSFITVYIETSLALLDGFAKDYALEVWEQNEGGEMVEHPFSDFYLPELDIDRWGSGSFLLN